MPHDQFNEKRPEWLILAFAGVALLGIVVLACFGGSIIEFFFRLFLGKVHPA